jgi:lysophospholipase L1-like esterase
MASPVSYSTARPTGLKRHVEKIDFDGKKKRLGSAKGFSENRCTIIADSLCHFMYDMLYTSIQTVPGGYARDVVDLCTQGSIITHDFSIVVVALGTNDLCDSSPIEIALEIARIIVYIRGQNPTCRIGISGILPHLCDQYSRERSKHRINTNKSIAAQCKKHGVEYFKSEMCITEAITVLKYPIEDLYRRQDGIHLSDVGIGVYKKYLEGKILSLLGLPPQWDPTTGHIVSKYKKK